MQLGKQMILPLPDGPADPVPSTLEAARLRPTPGRVQKASAVRWTKADANHLAKDERTEGFVSEEEKKEQITLGAVISGRKK